MTNTNAKIIDAGQLASLLENEGTTLVDVLTPEHFAARHIPGSVHACVYEVTFLDQVTKLGVSKVTPIVLYGAGGGSLDAVVAAEKLEREGYENLTVFRGGIEAWLEAGHALEGEAADELEPPHPELVLDKESYALVAEESVLRWTGRNNNGPHTGTLPVTEGTLAKEGDSLSGAFTLDMAGLSNTDLEGNELKPVLEDHLKSDDFFFVSRFPKALFEVVSMTEIVGAAATMPNYVLTGILDLRGVRKEVSFEAHLRPLGDGRITLMGNLDFDRTEWGVIYGSARFFAHLGYHVVHDDISVEFRLVLG